MSNSHQPETGWRRFTATVPVFVLLLIVIAYTTGEKMHARLIDAGESLWPGYAQMKLDPVEPTCDPNATIEPVVEAQAEPEADAEGEVPAEGDVAEAEPEAEAAAEEEEDDFDDLDDIFGEDEISEEDRLASLRRVSERARLLCLGY